MNYVIKVVKVILQFKKKIYRTHLLTFYRSNEENSITCAYQEQESKFIERSLQHTYLQKIVLNKMSILLLNKHF